MLNISQNTRHTSKTFNIDGIELIRALTTTRMPSNRDNAFRGRNALSVRNVLKAGMSAKPYDDAEIPAIATFFINWVY